MTPEERKAVERLKKAAEGWPASLWLYSANGTLYVMRKVDGRRVMAGQGFSPVAAVETIPIENDGGDW
jgi:hypothetical protein